MACLYLCSLLVINSKIGYMLKKIYLLFIFSLLLIPGYAQELKVEKVTLLETDKEAEEKPQYDGNQQLCALLKVYVDSLPDVSFNSSYIIGKKNIKYIDGYYNVYVVGGINSIEMKHNDYLPASINFKRDFQVNIEGGKTYAINLKKSGMTQKKTQTVVFNMIPRTGKITVNGKTYPIEKGVIQTELLPGKYTYTAQSTYYEDKKGEFEVTDVSKSKIIPLKLKAYTAKVNFVCNVPTAILYANNKKIGGPGLLEIPLGKHKVRVVAEDWKDYTQEIQFEKEGTQDLNVTLKPKPFIPVIITGKGKGKMSLFIDNKEVPEWKNDGTPVKIKQGRHLITITCEQEKDFETKEKVVRIDQNTPKIELKF